ncbi:MAG TPA: GNAT family N-acetyltransferase [Saprospiraceae bacterium]|nr:GNAT family N-acetyltransferase [Saprospiraceae bacterium]HMQ83660.1 GNAT family N-acetyltransferase [Saprospiraceae bacterium]
MALSLVPIQVNEDPEKPIFASENCQLVLQMMAEFYPQIGFHLPWVGYFIIKDDHIIGTCGFTGPPVNNRVEVSYWTFSQYENQGIASEACRQLVAIAINNTPTIVVVAKTMPEHNASTKVLQKNGFVYSGVVQDHEIGDAWEWIFQAING